ncbi:AAA family ATPase [Pseudonocardia charpentierae]|uniref:AAA family ATPase n=1 Tax=Pseudonocardia charpentierae TaxID=3075545 RepID=A0ABU2N4E9_9PSEU|nr:AAA family ATPase [Pseudonocardia sp. DSM 45834]MDT0348194.1 AAA family ATPase [Pseudonocardia sp. DSM 45834]
MIDRSDLPGSDLPGSHHPGVGLATDGLPAPSDPPAAAAPPPRRATRPKAPLWHRIRLLLLLGLIWLVVVWAAMADNPLLPFVDAVRIHVVESQWLLWLMGLELLRQIHYFVSERSAGYHRFWAHGVFGGFDRAMKRRFSDWTRFRLARMVKWIAFIVLFAVVAGQILDTSPLLALFAAPALLWQALPMILQLAFAFFFIAFQFIGLFWLLSRGGVDTYYPDDIKTRFSDVWGQDHVVQRIRENIMFLEKPDEIEAKGGYVPGGILLWGPPGTGKTLMAEAVAGETGRPYVFVDPGAFINMFMGVGILKVKSLFRKLRKLSLRYGGVIVFFDEADALGNRGSLGGTVPGGARGMRPPAFAHAGCHGFSYLSEDTRSLLTREAMASAGRAGGGTEEPERRSRFVMGGGMNGGGGGGMGTLQALLTELSGLKKPRGILNRWGRRALGMRPKPPPKYRILVMMATNMPESLDEALLRPGRIDRIYRVGYPSKAGRIRTYEGYLDKVPHEVTSDELDKLATITPYATGATIKDLVNEALITAIRDGREVISWRDLMKAKQLKDLGPPEDVEYIERERHAVAVHEACHAVVAYRTRQHMEIDLATIEKGSDYLGMVASIPPEDQFTRWRSEYEADILVSLASLAGERMFFEGDSSSGVSGDLESATAVASFMEGYWGMGHTVSSYSTARRLEVGSPGGGRGGPQKGESTEKVLRAALADRIEDQLAELLDRAEAILQENRTSVLAIAHALETHKTLTGEDIEAVVEGREGLTVDGRVYRDPGFISSLEDYHAAAAGAHRGHTSVKLALPAGGRRALPAAEEGDTAAATPAPTPSPYEPPR